MKRYKDYATRQADSEALETALKEAYSKGKDYTEASDYTACFIALKTYNLGFEADFKTARARFIKMHALYNKMEHITKEFIGDDKEGYWYDCDYLLFKSNTTTIKIERGALHALPTANLNKLYKLVCEG